jgi:hypothetical protein
MKHEFSGQTFGKKLKYQVSSKSVQWEQISMRTDRRTDMIIPIVAFRNYTNAPKNSSYLLASNHVVHSCPRMYFIITKVVLLEFCYKTHAF